MKYEDRIYRSLINKDNLVTYSVKISESDLLLSTDTNLEYQALQSLSKYRNYIEKYIENFPEFKTSLLPVNDDPLAPPIVREMISQSKICGVGPMASVAGAIAEFIGNDLSSFSENVIIENGGDIFLKVTKKKIVSIFVGESALNYKINLLVNPKKTPMGICTSSATIGPSFSMGIADAVCVASDSATLADAAATAIGNRVKSVNDIRKSLEYGRSIPGVTGIVIIVKDKMGAIGDLEFI